MTLTIGWWVAPAFITLAAVYVALRESPEQRGDYDFSPIVGCLYLAAALIVSLVSWLIWALTA